MEEIWKDIKDYEGKYQVSNLGNVKSLNYNGTGLVRLMKLSRSGRGYRHVSLTKNRIERKPYVHRLIAEAFIPNPENKPYIDHINTIRSDNRIENLRWVTRKENMNNPLSRVNMSGKFGALHHRSIPIIQYSKDGEFIQEFACTWEATRETGVHNGNLVQCCKGKVKTAGGYVWKYKNN